MQRILSMLIGCERAGHSFPSEPTIGENALVYLRRRLTENSKCTACGTSYSDAFKGE